jgi:hypothetical protein
MGQREFQGGKGGLTVDQLLDKLSLEVLDKETGGTALHGLLPGSLKVLLLSNIGHECNDLIALLNEPEKNARSVYTESIRQCI